MQCPRVPISIGELLDKITILQIKAKKTDNTFVHKELNDLITIAQELKVYREDYLNDLKTVNEKLWDIEDKLRELEDLWKFDDEFIYLARQVYITNDERARIKKQINDKTNSEYSEIKLY